MTWNIKVTKKNVQSLDSVAKALRACLSDILNEVEEYPVELNFSGYRVFFETKTDVHAFIKYLDEQLESSGAPRWILTAGDSND